MSPLNFTLLVPVFLTLWVLPWAALAVVIDRARGQFSVRDMLVLTVLCTIELSAANWLGYGIVLGGIVLLGVMVFIPAFVIQWIKRNQRKFLQRQLDAAVKQWPGSVPADNGVDNAD